MSQPTISPSKDLRAVDGMMADLFMYQDPKYLMPEYQELIDASKVNQKLVARYIELLSNVSFALKRVLRYKKYFEMFYPASDEIGEIEALNHHIYAYLEDMETLKNKLEVLLGTAKNDIKAVAINKVEVENFFDAAVEKTKKVFAQVSANRDPHRHKGRRFMDGDLLKAENADEFLKQLTNPVIDAMLNQGYKPTLVSKFSKEKQESFTTAKARWVKMAESNNAQVTGYLDAVIEHIQPMIYDFLRVQNVRQLISISKKDE